MDEISITYSFTTTSNLWRIPYRSDSLRNPELIGSRHIGQFGFEHIQWQIQFLQKEWLQSSVRLFL